MSDTYIGPFGRILPVADRPESPQGNDFENIPSRRHSAMTAARTSSMQHQLPPVQLQFGTDTRTSFTDPQHWSHSSHSSTPRSAERSDRPQLPSLADLISPSAPVRGPPPFTQHANTTSPVDPRHGLTSPHRPAYLSSSYQSSAYPAVPPLDTGRALPSLRHGDPNAHNSILSASSYSATPSLIRDRTQSSSSVAYSEPRYVGPPEGPRGMADQTRPELRTVNKPVRKCVGERDVPGEGLCYIYEDGTVVRKEIDGEQVNAQWGVTKAGKPRKRLAIACITCREKKIKCEPAEPKRVQCEKSGKECRFQTAVRNYIKEPRTPSYDQQAYPQAALGDRMEVQFDSIKHDTATSVSSVSPTSPDLSMEAFSAPGRKRIGSVGQPSKLVDLVKKPRQSTGQEEHEMLDKEFDKEQCKATGPFLQGGSHRIAIGRLGDPFQTHSSNALHYLELFFDKYNSRRYYIFPQRHLMAWLHSQRDRTNGENLVIFSMLAVGSIYSDRPESGDDGKYFCRVVLEEITKTIHHYSLEVVQSRLMIAFYLFALGDYTPGWTHCGSAFRSAIALRMHLEPDCILETSFDLHGAMLAECYRRTFWNVYCIDRFQSFCLDTVITVQKEDVFLRLPCNDDLYESNHIPVTPYFDNGIIDPELCYDPSNADHAAVVSLIIYLIQIQALAGDVLINANRSVHQSARKYARQYEEFYEEMNGQVAIWYRNLPPYFQLNRKNMVATAKAGFNDVFIITHTMAKLVLVILNYRIRPALMDGKRVSRNIQAAVCNSREVLVVLGNLLEAAEVASTGSLSDKSFSSERSSMFKIQLPWIGLAIQYCADISSCAGLLQPDLVRRTQEHLTVALQISEQIAPYFTAVRLQCKLIRKRLAELTEMATQNQKGAQAWRFKTSLHKNREEAIGLFYGEDSDPVLLEAIGVEMGRGHVLLR